jgi:hypothetical protein
MLEQGLGTIVTDMAKLKKKASLPKDKRLLNEKACQEILEFAKVVDEREAEVRDSHFTPNFATIVTVKIIQCYIVLGLFIQRVVNFPTIIAAKFIVVLFQLVILGF